MSGISFLAFLILASALPAIAVYLWFRIARSPYSTVWFLLLLFVGATACFPALFLQSLIPSDIFDFTRWGPVLQIFFRIALTEELSRLLVLFVFFAIASRISPGWQEQEIPQSQTDETDAMPDSAIVYGTAAGLVAGFGFAILESATYGTASMGFILLRAFTAAPLHGACGARIGVAAILLRSQPGKSVSSFLTAVAIHGVYNLMLTRSGVLSLVLAVLVAFTALASSIRLIRGGMKQDCPSTES